MDTTCWRVPITPKSLFSDQLVVNIPVIQKVRRSPISSLIVSQTVKLRDASLNLKETTSPLRKQLRLVEGRQISRIRVSYRLLEPI